MTHQRALSRSQARIYAAFVTDAEQGRRASTAEELQYLCELESPSTTVTAVKCLERRGLIVVERYQRARRITIMATGKSTAQVKNPAMHWRKRPASMPAPSLAKVRDKDPDFAREMMAAARAERMEFGDYLAELAWRGWLSIQAERGEG